jgi:hypothetical protein
VGSEWRVERVGFLARVFCWRIVKMRTSAGKLDVECRGQRAIGRL